MRIEVEECGLRLRDAGCGWVNRKWRRTQVVGLNRGVSLEGSAAFTTSMRGGRFGSGDKGRGNDATAGAQGFQVGPEGGGDKLAEGGSTRAVRGVGGFNKVKGSQKVIARVGEMDGVCPSNVLGGVGGSGGGKLNSGAVLDHAVFGSGIFVPEGPPALVLFREGLVGGGAGQEVTIEVTWRAGGCFSLRKVDLNEGKLGAEGCLESVGDEEESVEGVPDGGEEGSRSRGSGEGWVEFDGCSGGGDGWCCREVRGRGKWGLLEWGSRLGRGRGSSGGWGLVVGVKEVLVVGVATQWPAQLDGKLRDMKVQEPLIRAVLRGTRPEGGGQELKPTSVEFQGGPVGGEQPFDFVGSMREGFGDHERPAAVVAELINLSSAGVAVDLDAARDDIADLVGDESASGVG